MTKTMSAASIEAAADIIFQADALVVAAGAGMGVDSGLPDFRGNEGFWKAYPALGRERVEFHRIANPQSFLDNPAQAWGFYGHRLNLYRATKPHAGFEILKRWGESKVHGYRVFTSNVDGQFQAAGFDHAGIHECHGSIHHLQCLMECTNDIWSADDFSPEVDAENCLLLNAPPRCPRCGAMARPNVMMFGDWGWLPGRTAMQALRENEWLEAIGDHQRMVVVELGAGTAIPSVRSFGQRLVYEYGARLVRINPRESAVPSTSDVGLAGASGPVLAAIDKVLGSRVAGTNPPLNKPEQTYR